MMTGPRLPHLLLDLLEQLPSSDGRPGPIGPAVLDLGREVPERSIELRRMPFQDGMLKLLPPEGLPASHHGRFVADHHAILSLGLSPT
jgi:hypothetical protein